MHGPKIFRWEPWDWVYFLALPSWARAETCQKLVQTPFFIVLNTVILVLRKFCFKDIQKIPFGEGQVQDPIPALPGHGSKIPSLYRLWCSGKRAWHINKYVLSGHWFESQHRHSISNCCCEFLSNIECSISVHRIREDLLRKILRDPYNSHKCLTGRSSFLKGKNEKFQPYSWEIHSP
jgi:hypothetical protein